MSLAVNWAVTGDRFCEDQPVSDWIKQNHVRHLAVRLDLHTQCV